MHLLLILLSVCPPVLLFSQPSPDSVALVRETAPVLSPLIHKPPFAILNDRPYQVDFFSSYAPVEIASVSLFLRGDSSQAFKELPLRREFGRYRYTVPVEELRGTSLTYYFVVHMRDDGLWTYPRDINGETAAYVIDLVAPSREYFQQLRDLFRNRRND